MRATQQPVAIITGASTEIGLGLTQALLERGIPSHQSPRRSRCGVAMKTISNYLDYINPTPIGAAFEANAPEQPAE